MRFKEDIKSVADLMNNTTELLRQANESRRPVVITEDGRARAVGLDIGSYESLRDATLLLKMAAQGEADLQAGKVLPQNQALARVRSRLRPEFYDP